VSGRNGGRPKSRHKTVPDTVSPLGLGTDKAYSQVLDEARNDLGRDIDFSKQSDREAIGNKLIAHIRRVGACDVAGKWGGKCRQ
jgi:hypothetical protein